MIRTLAFLLVTGCVSIADIDTTHTESYCAQSCTGNYSSCASAPAPLAVQAVRNYQCKEALRACIAACPAR
jgi:hypothetical protein